MEGVEGHVQDETSLSVLVIKGSLGGPRQEPNLRSTCVVGHLLSRPALRARPVHRARRCGCTAAVDSNSDSELGLVGNSASHTDVAYEVTSQAIV
jgi:hypothetical protein